MTTMQVNPRALTGNILAPSSKSMGHREIICAGLAVGDSIVDNISMSDDIEATLRCLEAFGVKVNETASAYPGRKALAIKGKGKLQVMKEEVDCGESGSTLRFMLPLGALCNAPLRFCGRGKLVVRPLTPYYNIFEQQGIEYQTTDGQLPLLVNGRLKSGKYQLKGDVSSQFVSGLLFALPLLDNSSEIEITSPLESQSYVELTLDCLKKYGIIVEHFQHQKYIVQGRQRYLSGNNSVEGDWSQAAFWLVAGTIGAGICCSGLKKDSLQGDKVIVDLINKMGGTVVFNTEGNCWQAKPAKTKALKIDATDCPDIVPILTVLAAVSEGTTEIINAGRLRIKECDRLTAMTTELNKLGALIEELPQGLVIHGRPEGLEGGIVEAWNDHRIAMSLAIASIVCLKPVVIHGAESVRKSYPEFWQEFAALGGQAQIL